MSAGHDGQPQANQQPLIPDVASLPSDRCSVESLATQSELLVSGDAPSLYTHDQIEPILPSGSQVDVSVVAVLKLADGQECWVAAVSAKPGSSHAAHIKTVKHPSGREGAVVSHKQFFLVNPRAVIEDRESGALSKGRSSGVAPIGADPESAITIALNPNTEDAHDATTRCRLIIQEDGKLLVSNNGKDTVDVVIDSREHRDAQGIQSSAAIAEAADSPETSEDASISEQSVVVAIDEHVAELSESFNWESKVREHAQGDAYRAGLHSSNRVSSRNVTLEIRDISSGQPNVVFSDDSYGNINGANNGDALVFNVLSDDGGRSFERHHYSNGASRDGYTPGVESRDDTVIAISRDGTITASRTTYHCKYVDGQPSERKTTQAIPLEDVAGYIEAMARTIQEAVRNYDPEPGY